MKKVAVYCRVSTDHEDQANSFEAQQRYFREYITRHPEWELYDVYADEGVTGTSTEKRLEFQRMIQDAYAKKFELIITKEVSRFSRNTLDTLSYVRQLQAIKVGIVFANDGINTIERSSETFLALLSTMAQEESRKTSERVKWGQKRQMEQGVVFGKSMLGYDVEDGKMAINSEGAEIVKLIFHKYAIEKKGTSVIARELREAGYKSFSGNTKWTNTSILRIIKNEKYVGDLIQKKTYTPDFLTHKKKYNRDAEDKVCLAEHHEAIIDRDTWNLAQTELQKRNRHGEAASGHSNRYLFSGKIKCGICGASYVSRKKHLKNGSISKKWGCYTATTEGTRHLDTQGNEVGCDIGTMIRDDVATEMVQQAAATLKIDTRWIIDNVTKLATNAILASEQTNLDSEERLENAIKKAQKKRTKVMDTFFAEEITKEEMRMMTNQYDTELSDLQSRLEAVRKQQTLRYDISQLSGDIRKEITSIVKGETASEAFYKNLLDHMTVYPDKRVEICFNLIPYKWTYVMDKLQKTKQKNEVSHNDTEVPDKNEGLESLETQGVSEGVFHFDHSVPMSVSSPFSSGYGME